MTPNYSVFRTLEVFAPKRPSVTNRVDETVTHRNWVGLKTQQSEQGTTSFFAGDGSEFVWTRGQNDAATARDFASRKLQIH